LSHYDTKQGSNRVFARLDGFLAVRQDERIQYLRYCTLKEINQRFNYLLLLWKVEIQAF